MDWKTAEPNQERNHQTLKAKWDMIFNEGSFTRDKEYKYRVHNNECYITTDEGKEQEFMRAEVDIFFYRD